MSPADKILKWFVAKIDALQRERKVIDDKIAALELAYDALTDGESVPTPRTPRAGRAPREKRIRRDKQAQPKLLAFLQTRAKPTTVGMMAKAMGCSLGAVGSRCARLVNEKKVKRVARGVYEAVSS